MPTLTVNHAMTLTDRDKERAGVVTFVRFLWSTVTLKITLLFIPLIPLLIALLLAVFVDSLVRTHLVSHPRAKCAEESATRFGAEGPRLLLKPPAPSSTLFISPLFEDEPP